MDLTLPILQGAGQYLLNPHDWTQGALARDHEGEPCGVVGGHARSYCMLGALERCWHNLGDFDVPGRNGQVGTGTERAEGLQRATEQLADVACARIGQPPLKDARRASALVEAYNDTEGRTHKEVTTWVAEAIKAYKAKQA